MDWQERDEVKKIGGEQDIVIVGGGICGLATALAFHRKGIRSIVLERSEKLRATGVGIIMQPNGWRALDQLGVASKLRQTAICIPSGQFLSVDDRKCYDLPLAKGERRCLKRMDLVEALADSLPENTVHFGCQVLSVTLDPVTSNPILELLDGTIIKAKIVIGCDGVNSVISKFLGRNAPKLFCLCATRGFTYYKSGHGIGDKFRVYGRDNAQLGQFPVTDNLVYWFMTRMLTSQGATKKDPTFIKQASMEAVKGFPEEMVEMISNSEPKSLYLTELRYYPPWEVLRATFGGRGTVAVAGDAMHAMCPFISQGGAASLEDAVVLAKCLSKAKDQSSNGGQELMMVEEAQEALRLYVKARRMRVFWLSLQTYLIGLTLDNRSKIKRILGIITMILIFGEKESHSDYDCGRL